MTGAWRPARPPLAAAPCPPSSSRRPCSRRAVAPSPASLLWSPSRTRLSPAGAQVAALPCCSLLSADYLPELVASLPKGWVVVQPLLSSCYAGFGISSLDRDAAELSRLLHHLQAEGVAAAALLGFSTGAQVSPPTNPRARSRAASAPSPTADEAGSGRTLSTCSGPGGQPCW